jgi:hypothetical protein
VRGDHQPAARPQHPRDLPQRRHPIVEVMNHQIHHRNVERFTAAMATFGLRAWPAGMLFTGASVIAAMNCIVGGVGSALLAANVGNFGAGVALPVGIVVAVILFGLHLLYQQRQAGYLVLPPQASSASS